MIKNIHIVLLVTISFLLLCSCGKSLSLSNYTKQTIQENDSILHVDLDGDGTDETISLTTKEDIVLTVNNKKTSVSVEGTINDQDSHSVYEKPQLHILNEQGSKKKSLILTIVWNTNKIGTKTDLWSFQYTNNELKEVWNTKQTDEGINYSISNYKNGFIDLKIPQFTLSTQISIDKKYYEEFLSSHLEGQIDVIANRIYNINDYNNDGIPEIAIEKVISTGAIEWLPFTSVFEIFKIKNGIPKTVMVIPNDSSRRDILNEIITNGFISRTDNIDATVNDLIQKKIFRKTKDKIYLNILE